MKNAILKGVVGVIVVLATAGGVYVGGILPVLARGDFASGYMGFRIWIFLFPLLWIWAMSAGGLCAWYWRRRRFDPRITFALAPVATLLVFGPGLLTLLYGSAAWSGSYELAGRIVALASLSFFPSQVAFWGFAVVMRIGWKRRRTCS